MSSEDIPKVPQRPQRAHRSIENGEITQSEHSSASSVERPSIDASSRESPQIPATRPHRVKNKSPPPLDTATDCLIEKQDDYPQIPSTRPHRPSKEEESTTTNVVDDKPHPPPTSRPQRVRTTSPAPSAAPSTSPLAKAKTVGAISAAGKPIMPSTRPVRRSTTESLERLVQNTSEQLKEMEELISRHNEGGGRNEQSSQPKVEETDVSTSSKQDSDYRNDTALQKKSEGEHFKNGGRDIEFQGTSDPVAQQTVTPIEDKELADREIDGQEHKEEPDDKIESTHEAILKNELPEGKELHEGKEVPESEEIKKVLSENSSGKQASDPVTQAKHETVESKAASDDEIEPTEAQLGTIAKKETNYEIPEMPKRPSKADIKVAHAPSMPKGETPGRESDINISSEPEPPTIKKRAAPPVPKKPSSRIAAFQEMLQKNQLEQLQGSNQQRQPFANPGSNGSQEKMDVAHDDGKLQFRQNLNALFAIPGAPAPVGIPTLPVNKSEANKSQENAREKQNESSPIARQRRAKGPRGRKLPSTVATIEKVQNEANGNEIEIYHTWTTRLATFNWENERLVPEEEVVQVPRANEEGVTNNEGIEERRPSINQLPGDQSARSSGHVSNYSDNSLNDLLEEFEPDDLPALSEGVTAVAGDSDEEDGSGPTESSADHSQEDVPRSQVSPENREINEVDEN